MSRHLLHHDADAALQKVCVPQCGREQLFVFLHLYIKTVVGLFLSMLKWWLATRPLFVFWWFLRASRNVTGQRSLGRSVWMDTIFPLWRKTCVASLPCACECHAAPKSRPTCRDSSTSGRSLIMLTRRSTCGTCLPWKSLNWRNLLLKKIYSGWEKCSLSWKEFKDVGLLGL